MPLYWDCIAFGTIDPTDDEQTSLELSDVYAKDTLSTLDPQMILIGARRGKYYSSTQRSDGYADLWDERVVTTHMSAKVKGQFTMWWIHKDLKGYAGRSTRSTAPPIEGQTVTVSYEHLTQPAALYTARVY